MIVSPGENKLTNVDSTPPVPELVSVRTGWSVWNKLLQILIDARQDIVELWIAMMNDRLRHLQHHVLGNRSRAWSE